ncbi:rho GTPase-activating protein 21-like [Zophobas morio]|uniref:rho GTPase-activating protein 21-like n=1 Tax=Zophobas morio TaxID=2755281 RepID=UPI00308287E7
MTSSIFLNAHYCITNFELTSLALEKFGLPKDEASNYYLSFVTRDGEEKRFLNDEDNIFADCSYSDLEGDHVRIYLTCTALRDCVRTITIGVGSKAVDLETKAVHFTNKVLRQIALQKPNISTSGHFLAERSGSEQASSLVLSDWDIPYAYPNPQFVLIKSKQTGSVKKMAKAMVANYTRDRPSSCEPDCEMVKKRLDWTILPSQSFKKTGKFLHHSIRGLKNSGRRKSNADITAETLKHSNSEEIRKIMQSGDLKLMEKEMWETTPGLFTRSLEENTEGGSRVPLCIQRCWEAIEKRGLTCKGIYRLSGSITQSRELKLDFHLGRPVRLEEKSLNSCASVVKYFFTSIPKPLFGGFEDHKNIESLNTQDEKIEKLKQLFRSLPRENIFILNKLFMHLKQVAAHSELNYMQEKNIAVVFAPCLQMPFGLLELTLINYDPTWPPSQV